MVAGRESLKRGSFSSSVPNSLLLQDLPTPPPPILSERWDAVEPSLPPAAATATAAAARVASDPGEAGPSTSGHGGSNGDRSSGSDWVGCPECGSTIRGTDDAVNSHPGSCEGETIEL